MKLKKMTLALLITSLIIGGFAGCGDKKKATTTDENGFFVPSKQLELTVWNTQGTDYISKELKNNIVEDWLVKKTKVEIKNIYGNDGGQWDPKLTKLVAGNNLPDILYCGSWQGPAHFAKLDQLGKVWEITPEMLQKYAPEVWKRTPKIFWEKMKVNGKILGIPYNAEPSEEVLPDMSKEELEFVNKLMVTPNNDVTFQPGQTLWVRDDILKQFFPETKTYDELVELIKKMGEPIGDELLDIPIHSTEEFIRFMYDIKGANIKENGKTVYAFGYLGSDNWAGLSWLGSDMYGYKGHSYTGTWNNVKQRIEIPLVHDIIKQAAKTQNEMINDKVIDPGSLVNTAVLSKEKVLNGEYVIAPLTMVEDPQSINRQLKEAGKTYRYRPFITQVPAQKEYGAFKEKQLWGESLCILKTLSEKELHQVLNWINVQYTDEFEDINNWGPKEAGLYKETADGKRKFVDDRFTKYFVEGDVTALQPEETMGIQGPTQAGYKPAGLFSVFATSVSKWSPLILLRYENYAPTGYSGFKFLPASSHVKNVKMYPPCQGWASVYAGIPEVVSFWAERDQWENQFKMAMASSKDSFEEKWASAIDVLNKIVNVSEMERKMTEIAKPLADEFNAGNSSSKTGGSLGE